MANKDCPVCGRENVNPNYECPDCDTTSTDRMLINSFNDDFFKKMAVTTLISKNPEVVKAASEAGRATTEIIKIAGRVVVNTVKKNPIIFLGITVATASYFAWRKFKK